MDPEPLEPSGHFDHRPIPGLYLFAVEDLADTPDGDWRWSIATWDAALPGFVEVRRGWAPTKGLAEACAVAAADLEESR